jgi:hypothetical protein
MFEEPMDRWEQRFRETARAFSYPPTPDLARNLTRQQMAPRLRGRGYRSAPRRGAPRLAWAAAALLFLFALLLAVPSVRAQIIEFLQVGIIRIFLVEPTPTQTTVPTSGTGSVMVPGRTPLPTFTSPTTQTPRSSLLDLQGETSLEEASRQVPYPIQLPEYPEDLGEPDLVFLQDLEGQVLVLVWLDREQPDEVRMSLHTYGRGSMTGEKLQPRIVQETQVHDEPAVWAEGPYMLKLSNGVYQDVRLIKGHVLIWEQEEITYRLETDLPLEEAVRVAESLQPLSPSGP